jgi:hypothetical protein
MAEFVVDLVGVAQSGRPRRGTVAETWRSLDDFLTASSVRSSLAAISARSARSYRPRRSPSEDRRRAAI